MQNIFPPVIVAIAESSNRDGEGLPYWVQRVLNHLRLMADGEPASKVTDIRPLQGKYVYIAHIVPVRIIPHDFGILCKHHLHFNKLLCRGFFISASIASGGDRE